MTPGSDAPLRDFIYLDWEKIRSLSAQLFPGADGAVPAAFIGPGGEDLRFFRGATETPSLHQRVASAFQEELVRRGRATPIDSSFDFEANWTPAGFRDGQFVVTTGALRLLDFQATSRFLEATPELLKSAFHMANLPRQEKAAKDFAARRDLEQEKVLQQKQINEIKALKSEQFSASIRELYGDLVRLKVRPSADYPAVLFVGNCDRRHFLEPPVSVVEKYGYQIEAGWSVLGQINILPAEPALSPMPTGNSVLDTFETMALHFNSLMRLASAPAFPALSLTPLAIYRTIA